MKPTKFGAKLAGLLFGDDANADPHIEAVDPYFAGVWAECRQALKSGRKRIHVKHIVYPDRLEVLVHPDDFDEHFDLDREVVSAAMADELSDAVASLGYTNDVVGTVYPADLAQVALTRGTVRVSTSRELTRQALPTMPGRTGLRTLLGAGRRASPQAGTASPTGSSVRRTPSTGSGRTTPLARLHWSDVRGRRTVEIPEEGGSFGRIAPNSPAIAKVDPGTPATLLEASVISRLALSIEAEPWTGFALLRNTGQWPLRLDGDGAEEELAPDESIRLPTACRVVWPPPRGLARGFELEIEAPVVGRLLLQRDGVRQEVALRAPRTEVRADEGRFDGSALHLVLVDLGEGDGDVLRVLAQPGSPAIHRGGAEVGRPGEAYLWPVEGGSIEVDGIEVSLRSFHQTGS